MRYRLTFLLAVLAVVAAACGDTVATTQPTAVATTRPTTTTQPPQAAFPVTVETANGPLTLASQPERIVSLSATATEMLFAMSAGSQVVAVDEFSNYPAEAPITGLSGFQPNIEAIAEFTPDLVVIAFDPGDLATGLTALGIPTLVANAANNLDDTYDQIDLLGRLTGRDAEAAALIAEMKTRIADIVSELPAIDGTITYYHELDPTLYTATSATFAGEIYALLGLANIADAADSSGFGYPQLSAEYLIEQDPDFIFLADTKCCAETAATLAARPGWDQLTAVSSGRVIELDDDIASRWGPRVVDYFLEMIAEAVADLSGAGG